MLRGELVTLRAFEREDLKAFWEMRNDLEVESRVNGARPLPASLAQLEASFDERLKEDDKTFVRLAIEVEPELIGDVAIWGIEEHNRFGNLGIAIRRSSWGKGYGQDAIRTVLGYCFTHLNLRKISLQVLADDERAVGCYRAAGFVEEGLLKQHAWFDGDYRDVLWMSVFRP